jgi:hypothetical protein
MTEETPRYLRRIYLSTRKMPLDVRAFPMAEIWNDATNPALFRSNADHAKCRRIARACKMQIRRYGLAVRELSNGTLLALGR